MSRNGLTTIADTQPNTEEYFFVRNSDPVVIDNLVANHVITNELNLNGQAITADETAIFLNGVPYGGGGGGTVETVTGTAPITVTGTVENPVVGINLSGIVQTTGNQTIGGTKTFTADVDFDDNQLDGVSQINATTSLTLSAPVDVIANPLFGTFRVTGKQVMMRAIAPAGQEVSDSTLDIETDNDMTITATDALTITAGSMTIDNAVSMANHKITNVAVPTDSSDVATKGYVDGAIVTPPLSAVLTAGNSAGSSDINMNTNKITNCTATKSQTSYAIEAMNGNIFASATANISLSAGSLLQFNNTNNIGVPSPAYDSSIANKAYVDSKPVPTLAQVLTAGNQADADINMNGFDISAVNDITMSGLVPSITATNIAGNLVVSSAGTMNIDTAGLMTLASAGAINIGSADYTSIENLQITNSVVEKVAGTSDLTYLNVGSVSNANANVEINSGLQVRPNGDVMINTSIPEAKLTVNGSVNIYSTTNGDGVYFSPAPDGDIVATLSQTSVFSVNEAGVATNDPSVLAEFQGTTRGITIPTMTQTQREAIANPATGLLVFDTTASALYMYGSRGWAKVALTNSNNELLQSLSGLDSGTRTYNLTGLNEVDTLSLKTQSISALDPLINPGIAVVGDLALPPNATIGFGDASSGDGTLTATNAIHLNAPQVDTTTTYLQLNGQYTTITGDTISLNPTFGTDLQGNTRTTGSLSVEGSLLDRNTNAGTAGYVLSSTGTNVEWVPATTGSGVQTVVGGTNISVNNTDPANPVVSLNTATGINMNNAPISNANSVTATQVYTDNLLAKAGNPINAQTVKMLSGQSLQFTGASSTTPSIQASATANTLQVNGGLKLNNDSFDANSNNINNVGSLDTQFIHNNNGTTVQFTDYAKFNEGILDEDNSLGNAGQVLTTIFDGVNKGVRWVDAPGNYTFTAQQNIQITEVGNEVLIGFTPSPNLNVASYPITNATTITAPTNSSLTLRASGTNSVKIQNSDLSTPFIEATKSGITIKPWDGGTGTSTALSMSNTQTTVHNTLQLLGGLNLVNTQAQGNLLISNGVGQIPQWSTGLKYDIIRKVLYAG